MKSTKKRFEQEIFLNSLKGSQAAKVNLESQKLTSPQQMFTTSIKQQPKQNNRFSVVAVFHTRDRTWQTRWRSVILQESTHPSCFTYPVWHHGGSRLNKVGQMPFSTATGNPERPVWLLKIVLSLPNGLFLTGCSRATYLYTIGECRKGILIGCLDNHGRADGGLNWGDRRTH